ncbi:flagellar basal-body rod protein FlgG [Vibrio breoganii]
MMNSLWVAATGMNAQDAKMQSIANNLANVNTTAFKKDRVAFEDLMYSIQKAPGTETGALNAHPTGIQIGNGVKVVGTEKVHTQGAIQTTNQELDIAIMGKGFFQVENADGELLYTRNGQFRVNADGELVTTQGYPIVPNIALPDNALSVSISEEGIVSAMVPDQADPEDLGQLTLTNFANPAGLMAKGGNMFSETAASGEANELVAGTEGVGVLKQHALEASNVEVVSEMVEMVNTQRGFEMASNLISKADEMLQYAINRT